MKRDLVAWLEGNIARIKADERMKRQETEGPAKVEVNAPLALIQLALENQLQVYRLVLERVRGMK